MSWLNITKTSGTSGTTNVSVGAVYNENSYDRLLVKTVENDFDSKDVIFIQKANSAQTNWTPTRFDTYLTFLMLTDGSLGWYTSGTSGMGDFYYRINGGGWVKTVASGTTTFSVNEGDIIEWIGNCLKTTYYPVGIDYNHFIANDKCIVYGNIMSLIYGEAILNPDGTYNQNLNYDFPYYPTRITSPPYQEVNRQFWGLFRNCQGITDASELYLSSSILTQSCYTGMFMNCINLEKAPGLPAYVLATNCYNGMFEGCSKLNYIECDATDLSATDCLRDWVNGVAATGTFVKLSDVNWPTGVNGIPSGWTVVNI